MQKKYKKGLILNPATGKLEPRPDYEHEDKVTTKILLAQEGVE